MKVIIGDDNGVRGHHYHHEFFIYGSKVPLDPIGDAEGA